ncbi:hypothetical protein [Pantoea rodasii]|uniref:hypothetical protein n=1 Tax=Pantoea rodasii TaxID=1076549 RepID=UPI000A86DB50|nr:hypothetical protein [Pantoea rodasii]
MSIFIKIGIPMITTSMAMVYIARIKKDKNYLIPAGVLLAAGFVNVMLGLAGL